MCSFKQAWPEPVEKERENICLRQRKLKRNVRNSLKKGNKRWSQWKGKKRYESIDGERYFRITTSFSENQLQHIFTKVKTPKLHAVLCAGERIYFTATQTLTTYSIKTSLWLPTPGEFCGKFFIYLIGQCAIHNQAPPFFRLWLLSSHQTNPTGLIVVYLHFFPVYPLKFISNKECFICGCRFFL